MVENVLVKTKKGVTLVQKESSRSLVRKIRIAQAFSMGIFTLGLSMMAGDWLEYIESPISSFSLTTTLFGLMGTVVCELLARKAEKW